MLTFEMDVNLTGEAAVGEMEYMTVQKAFDAAVTESAVEKKQWYNFMCWSFRSISTIIWY